MGENRRENEAVPAEANPSGAAEDGGARKKVRRQLYVFGGVIVVFVVVVLWGASLIKNGWKRREDQRFLHDVALIQEAFTQLAESDTEHGLAPVESGHNEAISLEISKTPINGNWQIQQTQREAGKVVTEIVITNPNRSMREMEKIDAQIDDGDLSTGNFVLKGKDTYGIGVMESHKFVDAAPEDVDARKEKIVLNNKDLDKNYLKRSETTRDAK
ncbi:MAG: hypothetical protein LBI34_02550 [Puniceicoccales bacterium]|jgi:hypothetical protein|nr:hypothetical protein [Puniceicoccales bacterium]